MEIALTNQGSNDTINRNDFLGGIQIYDYTNLNLTNTEYSVSVTPADGSAAIDVGATVFSVRDDRLVWNSDFGNEKDLRTLNKITFTKKA